MAAIFYNPVPQQVNVNGIPLPGFKYLFFENGTTTPKNVFSDVAGTVSIGNEVTLDSRGAVPSFFGTGTYRVRFIDNILPIPGQVWERDDIVITSPQADQFSAYDAATTYSINDTVQGSDAIYYISLTNGNLDNNPVTDVVNWAEIVFLEKYNANKTYAIQDLAIGSDGFIYRSLSNGNINNDPTVSPNEWGAATNPTTASILPKGYLSGFEVTKDSGDTAHDVNFAPGAARDSLNTGNISTTSALIKRIDSNWVEGTNNGGFPSALSLSADTVYFLFLLLNEDGLAVDGGFDDNINATNLLVDADSDDYDRFRLSGYCVTDSSSNLDILSAYRTGTTIQSVIFQDGEVSAPLTTVLPLDNTIPQNNEGDEVMVTKKFAPLNATSKLQVDVVVNGASAAGANNDLTAALFQDSTVNALAASAIQDDNNSLLQNISFRHTFTAGSITPTQLKVRYGGSGGDIITFNGRSGARIFGGVMASSITITEISA